MAEILCAGTTHHPGLLGPDAKIGELLKVTLRSPRVPDRLRDPGNWPAAMKEEWGADEGLSAAKAHRTQIWRGFKAIQNEIRAFNPDFVLIWGDDQYEQFTEDCVPPFSVFILDESVSRPYLHESVINPRENNYWNDPLDKEFRYRGHVGASHLARSLLERGFDMAYSYKVRAGQPLPHSFLNTMMYLDFDRSGFSFPIVPVHVNCYGSTVIRSKGSLGHLFDGAQQGADPIAPTPKRCFDLGRATAEILRETPWRVAIVASSSWSHAFLTEKNGWLYPDMEADARYFEALKAGDYKAFGEMSLSQIEESGQQEVLNWCCLAGALDFLRPQPPAYLDYAQSYIFNSNKVMLAYPPI